MSKRRGRREYRGYYFEKQGKSGWSILTDLQEKELPGHRAYAGWAPNLATAKELVDAFWAGKATPWYESETLTTLDQSFYEEELTGKLEVGKK